MAHPKWIYPSEQNFNWLLQADGSCAGLSPHFYQGENISSPYVTFPYICRVNIRWGRPTLFGFYREDSKSEGIGLSKELFTSPWLHQLKLPGLVRQQCMHTTDERAAYSIAAIVYFRKSRQLKSGGDVTSTIEKCRSHGSSSYYVT